MIFAYDSRTKCLVFPDLKGEGKLVSIPSRSLREMGYKGCEDDDLIRSLPDPRGPQIVSPMQALAEMQKGRR